MAGVPYCEHPYSELIPGLWMGGHDYRAPDGAVRDVVIGDEFDLVLSLYRRPGCGPSSGVERQYLLIPDGPLSDGEMTGVLRLVNVAVESLRAGKRILVRCQAGYNRSGLVCALTLMRLGHTADEAVEVIRARRSPYALCNDTFVGYLRGRDVSGR